MNTETRRKILDLLALSKDVTDLEYMEIRKVTRKMVS